MSTPAEAAHESEELEVSERRKQAKPSAGRGESERLDGRLRARMHREYDRQLFGDLSQPREAVCQQLLVLEEPVPVEGDHEIRPALEPVAAGGVDRLDSLAQRVSVSIIVLPT